MFILKGYALGGILGSAYGWRIAFLICGIPGIVLSVLVIQLNNPVLGINDHIQSGEKCMKENYQTNNMNNENNITDHNNDNDHSRHHSSLQYNNNQQFSSSTNNDTYNQILRPSSNSNSTYNNKFHNIEISNNNFDAEILDYPKDNILNESLNSDTNKMMNQELEQHINNTNSNDLLIKQKILHLLLLCLIQNIPL